MAVLLSGGGLTCPPHAKFQTAIGAYPSGLDGIDGRIFSPNKNGGGGISPTPSFPVSPETPYGKKEVNLCAAPPAGRTRPQLLALLSVPVTTPPRYPSFSPPGPQMGSAGGLYKGAHGKKLSHLALLCTISGRNVSMSHVRSLRGAEAVAWMVWGYDCTACWGLA